MAEDRPPNRRLERVLAGPGAFFSTAYGNVGSAILTRSGSSGIFGLNVVGVKESAGVTSSSP